MHRVIHLAISTIALTLRHVFVQFPNIPFYENNLINLVIKRANIWNFKELKYQKKKLKSDLKSLDVVMNTQIGIKIFS